MAIIPLKQTVIVARRGEPDRWGNAPIEEFTLKCRFVEGTKMTHKSTVQNGSEGVNGPTRIKSEEVVSVAQIFLDKYADVKLTDEFKYTDETGNTLTYLPINIQRIRGLNGKAMLTVVNV